MLAHDRRRTTFLPRSLASCFRFVFTLLWLPACSSSNGDAPPANGSTLTFYRDVKPVIDAYCVGCHSEGNIGPFALTTPEQVVAHKDAIVTATAAREMPPWPPAAGCTEYTGDRSLAEAQIATLKGWVERGAAIGNPADFVALPDRRGGLSRVDRELRIPVPYTPLLRPDDYRCFLLDWPETSQKFITGFGVVPGNASIVHHVLAYAIPPAQLATYQGYDDADPGPGYTCFGGPRPAGDEGTDLPNQVAGWAPGVLGIEFAASTGIGVEPGSKIVVQMHYNTSESAPTPDQTAIRMKIDDAVDKPAYTFPFTNPSWVRQRTMHIAAGAPETIYSFAYDAGAAVSLRSGGAIPADKPFTIYSAALHMHLRGTHANLSLLRSTAANECLLDIPHWDFHWQGGYRFASPKTVNPGDQLRIECHWDNSAGSQPVIDGQRMPPRDLNWGEGTHDEMCISFLYATQ